MVSGLTCSGGQVLPGIFLAMTRASVGGDAFGLDISSRAVDRACQSDTECVVAKEVIGLCSVGGVFASSEDCLSGARIW